MVCALAAVALLAAGCDQQSRSTSQNQVAPKVADAASNMSAAADDAAITAKVKAALIAEPGLKSMEIKVETSNGTVTLSGGVDNADLRDKAKQIASSTSGVKGVIDNLTVKTTS
jgi:osmotically-inducible protein OsmY